MPDWSTNPAMEDQFEDEYEIPLTSDEEKELKELKEMFEGPELDNEEQKQKDYDRAMKGV